MLTLYSTKKFSEIKDSVPDLPSFLLNEPKAHDQKVYKYASWTAEKLRINAVRVLKEFLKEAPPCHKTYSNAYYYLAFLAHGENNMKEFKEYYELGQDAEEKRLPFLDAVDLPLKDMMSPTYQPLLTFEFQLVVGTKLAKKKVRQKDLKSCICNKKYCSK